MKKNGLVCLMIMCVTMLEIASSNDDCKRQEKKIEQGRECRKECETDAECQRKDSKKSCICDDVCGMSCLNPDADCEEPERVANGDVTFQSLAYNSVATYTCKEGFVLLGKSTRTCRSDKKWSGKSPECAESSCEHPKNVGLGFPDTGLVNFAVGVVVTYKCRFGYSISGDANITCQEDHNWSAPKFLCSRVNCGHPEEILNGYFEAKDFLFGSWAHYSCNEGYELSDVRKRSKHCSTTGRWSGYVSECIVKTCAAPEPPENGRANVHSFEFQSIVTYECNQGYVLEGNKEGICGDDGKWGPVPKCNLHTACGFDAVVQSLCGYKNTGQIAWQREFLLENTRSQLPGYVLAFLPPFRSTQSAILSSAAIPRTNPHCLQFYYRVRSQLGSNEDVYITVNGRRNSVIAPVSARLPESRWVGFQTTLQPVEGTDLEFEIVAQGKTKVEIDDLTIVQNECNSKCLGSNPCQHGGMCVSEIDDFYCSCTAAYTGRLCERQISCDKPVRIQFGTITSPVKLTIDQWIWYKCDSGFEMEGSSSAICGRNGQLSSPPPTCRKTLIFEKACPGGYIQHRMMCYRFHKTQMTYSRAKEACEKEGARLAIIQSEKVSKFIYKELPSTNVQDHYYWLGLTTNDWNQSWVSGTQFTQAKGIDYDMKTASKDGCGAYYFRGKFSSFAGEKWAIGFYNCDQRQRAICEKWNKHAVSYYVRSKDAGPGSINGVYKPVPGLLTNDGRQVYSMQVQEQTVYLYYFVREDFDWGWYIGDYSIELSSAGSWRFRTFSTEQSPSNIAQTWKNRDNMDVDITIEVNDKWTTWSEWNCDVACGVGEEHRTRTCDGGEPGSVDCQGSAMESRPCELDPCSEDKYEMNLNGVSYLFVQTPLNKIEAQDNCVREGRSLAKIRGEDAQRRLISMIKLLIKMDKLRPTTAYWIGAVRSHQKNWVWGDGTEVSDNYWMGDGPGGKPGVNDCVELRPVNDLKGWNDIKCSWPIRSICEKVTARPCESEPCINGVCKDNGSSYICDCSPHFTGPRCNIAVGDGEPCSADPCHGYGTCSIQNGVEVCDCDTGYSGDFCELYEPCGIERITGNVILKIGQNLVSSKAVSRNTKIEISCINSESNVIGERTITCLGNDKWSRNTNIECEAQMKHDLCSPDPCSGAGNCILVNDNPTCDCNAGYSGAYCEIKPKPKPSPCQPDTCNGVGNCYTEDGRPICFCKTGYSGDFCEIFRDSNFCTLDSLPHSSMKAFDENNDEITSVPTNIESGAALRFTCTSSSFSGDKVLYCTDGVWSSEIPTQCASVVTCPSAPVKAPLNGRLTVDPPNSDPPYSVGVRVSFSCDEFYATTGAPSMVCQSDGKWSHEPTECKEVGCLLFQYELNDGVTVKNQDRDFEAEKGDSFTLRCESKRKTKKIVITCKGRDVWDPPYMDFKC